MHLFQFLNFYFDLKSSQKAQTILFFLLFTFILKILVELSYNSWLSRFFFLLLVIFILDYTFFWSLWNKRILIWYDWPLQCFFLNCDLLACGWLGLNDNRENYELWSMSYFVNVIGNIAYFIVLSNEYIESSYSCRITWNNLWVH